MNIKGVLPWLLLLAAVPGRGQMISPDIDRPDEPFCYFRHPTDVIGVMDGPEATLVTPEGYLYTGFAELMFFTGNPPVPVSQRVKTLERGYLPIVQYQFEEGGIRYAFSVLAATLDGNPESPLMNFVRVKVENLTTSKRTAWLGTGCRYENDVNTDWGFGDNRFARPSKYIAPGKGPQAGEPFDPAWTYELRDGCFLRGGKVIYLYPESPAPRLRVTLKTGDNTPFLAGPQQMTILPSTPAGIALYRLPLDPGEAVTLDFRMPYEPLAPSDTTLAALRRASPDACRERTRAFWGKILGAGIGIELAEQKAVDAFKANLVYDLIARNRENGSYVQKVNEFQYDAFWLRDASHIVRMYDVSGYHDIARQCLDYFSRWQQPDGNFVSQGGQYDGFGQTLWAYGQHYRMTRDSGFAAAVYPSVLRAVAWLRLARQGDPFHLIPRAAPGDNEDIEGHITGHNVLALGGLKNAILLAEANGQTEDAHVMRDEYQEYLSAWKDRLRLITGGTGGAIPPGLDTAGGQDWGNMETVYPEAILDPHDPYVTATLEATRRKYQEGLMTYGNGRWLHHYLTISNTETEVLRGDQQQALEEFYALLLHTSATHAGFEYCILPWGTRDFGMNLSPHGLFSAKFRTLLRDMLAREAGDELHLFSCVSPAWVGDGATLAVRRAPIGFGTVNAEMKCSAGGAVVTLDNAFIERPRAVVLHLPWFMNVRSVRADGVTARVEESSVRLGPDVRRIEIRWTPRAGAGAMSYRQTVRRYQDEYRKRYQEYLTNGN